jgi:hypothetical protein
MEVMMKQIVREVTGILGAFVAWWALAVRNDVSGAFGLQAALRSAAFPYVLFYMALVYWLLAPLLYRHARRLPNML